MTDKTVKLRLEATSDTLPPAAKAAKDALDTMGNAGKEAGAKIDAGLASASDAIKRTGDTGKEAGDAVASALEAAANKSQDFNEAMLSGNAAMGGAQTGALDLGNAVNRLVESEANAASRIRDVVSASLAQQAAWASGQAAANREAEARRAAAAATDEENQARMNARASYDALGASASAYLDEQNALRSAMEQEAKSLDDVAEKRAWYADALSRSILSIDEHAAATAALDRQEKAIQQSMAKTATEVQNLVSKYAPAHAALAQIEADERKLTEARDAGTISQENYERAIAGLNTTRARWMAEAEGVDEVGTALGRLNLTSREALAQYLQVGRSLASGDWEAASRSIMQAANSVGLLRGGLAALGSVGGLVLGTVLAVVTAVVSLGAAYTIGYLENQQYNQGLVATGGFAGKTAIELRGLATDIGATTGEYSNAREAINGLVNTGKIVGDQLGIAAQAAVDLASVTGQSIDQATNAIARLADDPVKAVRALDEQLHLLTATQYQQIRALEEQGDKQGAATLAMQIAADELAARRVDIVENLGVIERWVNQTAFAWGNLWEKMKDVGRADSFGELNASLLQLEERKKALLDGGPRTSGFDWLNDLTNAGYRDELDQLEQKIGQVRAARDALSSPVIAAQQRANDQQWEEGIKSATDALSRMGTALSEDEVARQIRRATQGMDTHEAELFGDAVRDNIRTQLESSELDRALLNGQRNLQAVERDRRAGMKETVRTIDDLNNAQSQWANLIDRISGKMGPAAKAQSDYEIGMRALEERAYALAIAGGDVVTILAQWQKAEEDLTLRLNETNTAIDKQSDVVGNVLQQLREETATAGMTERQRYQYDAVMKAKGAWAALSDEQRAAKPLTDAMTASLADQAGAIFDNAKQADEWSQRWEQASGQVSDALADVIVDGLDDWDEFGDALVDIAKRSVSQILSEFLRLQVINPILNGLLGTNLQAGGGGFNLGSLATMFGGGSSGPALGSAANAGGNGFSFSNLASVGGTIWKGFSAGASAFSGQGIGGLFNLSNWSTAGNSVLGGFTNGLSNVFPGLGSMFGSSAGAALVSTPGIAAGFTGGGGLAYTGTGFGGTFGGGTGAYASTTVGGAASGAGSAMTAMLSNPVTWILAGAAASAKFYAEGWRNSENTNNDTLGGKLGGGTMLADKLLQGLGLSEKWAAILSGSSLHTRIFGRKDPVVQSSALGFDFNDDGGTGSMVAQIKEKGGWLRSDKRYSQTAALDAETQAAVDEMFATFQAAMTNSAAMLGVEAPALVASSIKQNFDKAGKLTSTMVTVLGRQWTESMEDAIVRIGAEQVIAAVGVSAEDASAIAEQWRGSAAMLAEGAQFLLAAQADINAGGGLLRADPGSKAAGGGLAEVTALIQRLNVEGETLAQTYVRVATAAATLDAAVELTGQQYSKTRAEFVEFAAEMATAAGGNDQLAAYWSNYYDRFYSMTERAQVAFDRATVAADTAFGKIGLNFDDFAGADGAAAFRKLFEERMPTLTGEATVQWLKAAAALGIVIDTSAALAQSTGNASIAIVQSAEQLANVQAILDSNAWSLAAAGLNAAERAIRDINKSYADQREQLVQNLATEKQLAILEEQRLAALQAQYDGFAAQFRPQADQSTLAGQQQTIRAWEADQIAQLEAYAKAAGMEGVAAEDLANVHAEAARRMEAAQAVFQKAYQDFMDQFRPDRTLADGSDASSVAEAQAQGAIWGQAQVDTANQLAIAAGHAGASAEDIKLIWARVEETVAATQARLIADYDNFVAQFRPDTAISDGSDATTLAEAQTQNDAWVKEQIRQANALAIAAGMAGIAHEDLVNILATGANTVAAVQARLEKSYQDIVQGWRESQDETQSVVEWFAEQATLAHEAAIAAGRNGTAAEDLAALYSSATNKLIDSSAALAKSLYGTSLDRRIAQLQQQLNAPGAGQLANHDGLSFELARLQREQAEKNASQQRVADARTLAGNLAQLMAFQDVSLDSLAKQFDFPLASLAGDLGMSVEAMTDWIEKQANEARGLTTIDATLKATAREALAYQREANELLRRIVTGERTLPIDETTIKQQKPAATSRDAVAVAEPIVGVVVDTKERDSRAANAMETMKVSLGDIAAALALIAQLVPLTKASIEQRALLIELTAKLGKRAGGEPVRRGALT